MSIIWIHKIFKMALLGATFVMLFFTSGELRKWWVIGTLVCAAIIQFTIWKLASPEERKVVKLDTNPKNVFFMVLLVLLAIIFMVIVWRGKQ